MFDNQPFRAGQLAKHMLAWRKLGAPKSLINIIKGYVIPFWKRPPITFLTNKTLSNFQTPASSQMDQEVSKMIEQKTLRKLNLKTGFISKMFLTPKSDGKWRPVFNLKRLNEFVKLQKFRLVNHRKLQFFLQKGDYMTKIDLSQAYLHIPIARRHWRYLGIQYRNTTYAMTALPFGLSSAPQIFAKTINWVAKILRYQNIRLVVYLDDFLIVNQNPQRLKDEVNIVLRTLKELGFQINWEKSVLTPTKSISFLGVHWNTDRNRKSLPLDKATLLRKIVLKCIKTRTWSWQQAKSILGRMEFASFAIPLARLHCRKIQRTVNRMPGINPNARFKIDPEIIQELRWWSENMEKTSKIVVQEPDIHLITDASNTGWGATLEDELISGLWTQRQKQWHINKKEMYVIYEIMSNHQSLLQNRSILIQCDNKTVVAYLKNQGGTKSPALLKLAGDILKLALHLNIEIRIEHIPGQYNVISDHLSRGKSLPDWHLSNKMQETIFKKWGTPEIDLFATRESAVVEKYVTQFPCQQSEFVNAFTRTWNYNLAWIFPPPPLIPRILQHINQCQGTFILIVPRWENVFWRPIIKKRSLDRPFTIRNLCEHLIDIRTNQPPPKVQDLSLEAWKIRGGPL
uniref:Reverse transcriptase domain-containing protein n=1 Tax=Heliothis virescens TaxID=7102 RepID=A0A2A4J4H2_HELVI